MEPRYSDVGHRCLNGEARYLPCGVFFFFFLLKHVIKLVTNSGLAFVICVPRITYFQNLF